MAIHLLASNVVETETNKVKRAFKNGAKVIKPVMLNDGGGLYLQVAKNGSISWIKRFVSPVHHRTRDMGLDPAHKLGLSGARDKSETLNKVIYEKKLDPIDERKKAKASKNGVTFRQRFEYMKKHSKLTGWEAQLKIHALPFIGDKVAAAITTEDCVDVIGKPFHAGKFEVARKLHQRIQAVLQSATGKIETVAHKKYICLTLRGFKKVRKNKPHPSLDFDKLPRFMRDLRAYPDIAARAAEFVILTVCRKGDVNGVREKLETKRPMMWDDIDRKRRVWKVPAVKTADDTNPEPFEIPLSDAAWDVLMRVEAMNLKSDYVFPSPAMQFKWHRHEETLGFSAIRKIIKDVNPAITVHGNRTTFRTWASEMTNVERDVIETAMSHKIFSEDKAEAPYKSKITFFNKRKALMQRWGEFATGKTAKVLPFKQRKAA